MGLMRIRVEKSDGFGDLVVSKMALLEPTSRGMHSSVTLNVPAVCLKRDVYFTRYGASKRDVPVRSLPMVLSVETTLYPESVAADSRTLIGIASDRSP